MVSRGNVIRGTDMDYFVEGFTSVINANETIKFLINDTSAFLFLSVGAGTNQFGIYYINNGGSNNFIQRILGDVTPEVSLDPSSKELVIRNTVSWPLAYSIIGRVTQTS